MSIETTVKADLSYVSHHIFLLIAVIVLAFAGVYGVESLISRHDATNDSKWQTVLQSQTAQTKILSDKLTADESLWAQQNAAYQATITTLGTAIIQRNRDTAVQVQHDATLSAFSAAQRLASQTKAQPGEVTAQGENILMDLSVSRTVVSALDLLPSLQADLTDTQKQLSSETSVAGNLQSNITEQQAIIQAMKEQSVTADKACKAEITAVKAEARKSKLKWSGVFMAIGMLLARVI